MGEENENEQKPLERERADTRLRQGTNSKIIIDREREPLPVTRLGNRVPSSHGGKRRSKRKQKECGCHEKGLETKHCKVKLSEMYQMHCHQYFQGDIFTYTHTHTHTHTRQSDLWS